MITTTPALNYAQKNKDAPLTDIQIFRITGGIKEEKKLSSSHPKKLSELTKKLTKHYQELVHNSHVWGQSK
ncbi:MAG: hypothetical protein ISR39_09070 [Akkermansiaceae bacterium]|nr:hypothetical protein [Akkermansiaceae bacterium]